MKWKEKKLFLFYDPLIFIFTSHCYCCQAKIINSSNRNTATQHNSNIRSIIIVIIINCRRSPNSRANSADAIPKTSEKKLKKKNGRKKERKIRFKRNFNFILSVVFIYFFRRETRAKKVTKKKHKLMYAHAYSHSYTYSHFHGIQRGQIAAEREWEEGESFQCHLLYTHGYTYNVNINRFLYKNNSTYTQTNKKKKKSKTYVCMCVYFNMCFMLLPFFNAFCL